MDGLPAAALADLAGVTEAEVQRLADLGILAPRDGTDPFLASDVRTVRLATARAGRAADGGDRRGDLRGPESASPRAWPSWAGRRYGSRHRPSGATAGGPPGIASDPPLTGCGRPSGRSASTGPGRSPSRCRWARCGALPGSGRPRPSAPTPGRTARRGR